MKHVLFAVFGFLLAVTMSHAQARYQVQAGDVLTIEVLEDSALSRTALVLPDGRFSFPFAGSVRASGRTVDQIRRAIVAGIAGNFAAPPTVFVSVATLRPEEEEEEPETISVYFLGEVNTPGLRPVEPGTTLLQAMSQAGGFTSFAATKRVQLRRTNKQTGAESVSIINYKALSRGAQLYQSIRLHEGDVILVPERRLFE